MRELEEILLRALREAGLRAGSALPGEPAGRVTEPVCALSLTRLETPEAGFGSYLGLLQDEEKGEAELYGRRFDAELTLQCYAPEAALLNDTAEAALQALTELRGLTIQDCALEGTVWDDAAEAFTRALTLHGKGMLYALRTEEDGWFTDFRLVPRISGKGGRTE